MIIRAPRAEHYTVLNTATFNIPMPAECLGVYLHLLSKPDDWKVQPEQLALHFQCGAQRIYTILKKFVDEKDPAYICVSGRPLITRERVLDPETKKVVRWDYVVHEPPLVEKPDVEKPQVEKPDVEKPLVENHRLQITDNKQITDNTKRARAKFAVPDWIPHDLWSTWMDVRKRKRAVNSEIALKALVTRLEKIRAAGYPPEYAITTAIEKSWQSIDLDWLINLGKPPSSTNEPRPRSMRTP